MSAIAGFAPNVGGQVRGLGITPTTVFAGGNFMSANGIARTRLAAFQVSNGAMTSWAPAAAGGYVWAMTMSPDLSRVIPAGSFTTLSGQPAYGMGSVMASDATVNPWPAQEKIRAAGANGAITSIKADATQVYGTSYAFGAGAAYEGTFAVDPMTGQINWQNDCLGDTYDIAAAGPVLYNVSHQHDCTVIDGWPDTNPRVRWQKAGAHVLVPHRHPDQGRRLRLGQHLRPARAPLCRQPPLVPELRLRLLHQRPPGGLGRRHLGRRPVGRRRR